MKKIHVDGKTYEVREGQNLLEACLSLGFDLPYFCWHPALGSVGACRQCAVKQFRDENDDQGKLTMACMTAADDDVRISIKDPEAAEFRAMVIEGMMQNHPHDCPVCDEGGECHLQDMTVMTGHNYRRYDFAKRTFRNQYLGPFVNHEINRCIQCYRCVRYYRDYAGGKDLHAFHLHDTVFFGRHEEGPLESEFSGNLVEICPTGVFTDATLKQHYTRKWDLQMAPSICVHCSLGCNVSAGERYGSLRRIVNRYNHEVNGYFLCDRGRFGYEFVNSERRLRQPLLLRHGEREPVSQEQAARFVGERLASGERVIGIGSPRASLEANFALRTAVGADRFYAGVSGREHRLARLAVDVLRTTPARIASLHDVEEADAVLVLGEDVNNTAPRMALSLRQSVLEQPRRKAGKLNVPDWNDAAVREIIQDEKGPLFLATAAATRLDDIATATLHGAPDDIARFGFAVAQALDDSAPPVPELDEERRALASRVAEALKTADRPLVISGSGCRSEAVIQAAANVARALSSQKADSGLALVMSESNTCGLALLAERSLNEAIDAGADTIVVLENDLYQRAGQSTVDRFLDEARHVIVIDHVAHRTGEKADLTLPAGTFAESDGTLVNNEGRAQRFFQVFVPSDGVREGWRWLRDAMRASGRNEVDGWSGLDEVLEALAAELPDLAAVRDAAPSSRFRIAGERVPRAPYRYSGRTAMHADIDVHEIRPAEDKDSPLSFSMEGSPKQPPAALTPFFWSPGWNSIQAANKYQEEVGGPLRSGPSGVHLIAAANGASRYFDDVPPAFARRDGQYLFVSLHRVFGSEELSRLSPAIEKAANPPALALSERDAERLSVAAGDRLQFTVCGEVTELPAAIENSLPEGVAGVPVGFVDTHGLPAWSEVTKR